MLADTNQIARPYAKAIFEIALEEKNLEKWFEMLTVARQIAEDPNMQRVMKHPHTTGQEKINLFQTLGKEVFSDKARMMLQVLGMARRLKLLPEITSFFEKLKREHENEIVAHVVSAAPLEEENKKQFSIALTKRRGAKISLVCSVDPSLIGGAKIRIGDWLCDGTVKGHLAQLIKAVVL